VQACAAATRRPDDAIARRHYPVSDQQRFVREVAARIGFDFQRGRLDTTEHPFCSGLGPDDCRITTRWDEGPALETGVFLTASALQKTVSHSA
jgi:carboxypeptidase Taq